MAIKRYLYSHVRSSFLRINVDEMALARIYLIEIQFQGRSLGGVFAKKEKFLMAILRGGRRIGNYDIRIGLPRDKSLVDVEKDPRLQRQHGEKVKYKGFNHK